MLWLAMSLSLPPYLKNMVILCETNRFFTDTPTDIAECFVSIGLTVSINTINYFICVFIPRDESWSRKRILIKDVNRNLEYLCLKNDFSFID